MRYADAIMWNPDDADQGMWQELRAELTEPELVEPGCQRAQSGERLSSSGHAR